VMVSFSPHPGSCGAKPASRTRSPVSRYKTCLSREEAANDAHDTKTARFNSVRMLNLQTPKIASPADSDTCKLVGV